MQNEKKKLLIVEDEETILGGMCNYIRRNAPFIDVVHTAQNGQEALDILFRSRPQVMLLDIQLPVKDGIAVMKEAKAAGVLPRTIILSGHDEFRYAQQALRYGAVDYLLKPCRSSEILERVRALFAEQAEDAEEKPSPEGTGGQRERSHLVQDAVEHIQEHYAEDINLTVVADALGVTASYLSTQFKRALGHGFSDHLNRVRIERACDYFFDRRFKMYEIAYKVGFRDEKYFSIVFKKVKGISPSEYRKTCVDVQTS